MGSHSEYGSRFSGRLRTPGRLLVGLASPSPLARRTLALAKVAVSATTLSAAGLLLASSVTAPHLSMEAPTNPSTNIAPSSNFLQSGSCTGSSGNYSCTNPCVSSQLTWPVFSAKRACTAYVLEAINNARAQENVGPMVLPSNWDSLTIPEQMLVATNLERVARGYPPYLGLNANLDRAALSAATQSADPDLAKGFAVGFDALGATAFGGSWSAGFNVLAGDYMMMYSDGWGGSLNSTSNIACTSPSAGGCWAHRDELLGSAPNFNPGVGLWCDTCEFGAGYAIASGSSSYTQVIEMPAGVPPPLVFTWQSELPYFPSGAIGTVKTISLVRVTFGGSSLGVRWSAAGVQNVSLATVYTFLGSQCAQVGRVASFRYVPVFNISLSTVTMSGANYFPRGTYSAVVRIYTPGGSLTSGCVVLGPNWTSANSVATVSGKHAPKRVPPHRRPHRQTHRRPHRRPRRHLG